jgi:bifunctional DNase/RNase
MIRYALIIPVLGFLILMLYYTGSERQGPALEDLVEVELEDMGIDPAGGLPVLILSDKEKGKVLPVYIGIHEAASISRALDKEELMRPMTHDLIVKMLEEMGASLTRVVIKDLEDNVFFADMVIKMRDTSIPIDCRPSDAIAIAVRLDAPIYISRDILEISLNEELTRWWRGEGGATSLGIEFQAMTRELARAMGVEGLEGVLVSSVDEGGVAGEAGIVRGDVVLSVDGDTVTDPEGIDTSLSEKAGSAVDILVSRKGVELHIEMIVPSYSEEIEYEH